MDILAMSDTVNNHLAVFVIYVIDDSMNTNPDAVATAVHHFSGSGRTRCVGQGADSCYYS